ncbi:DNA methyltransferase [Pseudomonas aeruginosa]
MPYRLHLGDCLQVLKTFPDNSFDSVVTDPPYGIRFMGKAWDGADIEARAARRAEMPSHAPDAGPNGGHRSVAAEAGKYDLTPKGMLAFQAFTLEWAAECLRVLRPGGHLLSFASPRTYHHMAVGIEMAGFEIRDQIMWVFGSGFPKSHNLSGEFEGWGTALKPGHEPICMARKPLVGTVAANVLAHGTGALNIDACRIPTGEALRTGSGGIPCRHDEHVPRTRSGEASAERRYIETGGTNFAMKPGPRGGAVAGRWPANLIHDGSTEVVALFPADAGQAAPLATRNSDKTRNSYGTFAGSPDAHFSPHDAGGSAARFFYCAKASRKDRNEGCDELPKQRGGMVSNTSGKHSRPGCNWFAHIRSATVWSLPAMSFDESPAVRRINTLCSHAPARYLHIPTGIHWVVIDSLGNVLQLENIERRRRLITVSDLETEAWRKLP